MSQERRKRQQQRERKNQPKDRGPLIRKLVKVVLIAAAFGVAGFLGLYKRAHRYDSFAQCTADKGAKMYGAYWCPHCAEQKEDFGAAFRHVNYIECGIKGNARGQTDVCKQAGIKHYPTWEFADQSRIEGNQTMQFLSGKTGCSLP